MLSNSASAILCSAEATLDKLRLAKRSHNLLWRSLVGDTGERTGDLRLASLFLAVFRVSPFCTT